MQQKRNEQTMIEHDLNRMRDKLLVMGGAAEKAIALAARALIERESEIAERVISDDDVVDKLELEIDAMCAEALSSKPQDPQNLRCILSIARTAPIVERIADHTVNLAKHALALNNEPQLEMQIDISRLTRIVQEMLLDGLDAFTSGDIDRAQETITRDDEVDSLYDIFYAQVVTTMQRDSTNVERGAEWLFVLKHFERIADYATNICEQTVYMARGQVIKHTIW
jgi:phosphate transport system protein